MTQAKKDKFVKDMDIQIKKATGKSDVETKVDKSEKEDLAESLSRVADPNPLYPALHKDIQVKYTKKQGR